ncbi:MAG: hypothetical protein GF331_00455 [Chitinivibrionales bacterium]|nr:hypothetical protein [Chitinivibrionales bacterium]
MDIKHAMYPAGTNLLNCLNRDRDYLPFWSLEMATDGTAEHLFRWPAHNIERWWNAMLRLEHLTGFEIPSSIEAAMLADAYRFFDNPDRSVDITETRDNDAQFTIRPGESYRLLIRIPGWTDKSTLVAKVNEQDIPHTYVDSVLLDAIAMRYALPEKTVVEPTMGTEYTLHCEGDEVMSISPNLDFLPFYSSVRSIS